jgi:hypothetical protein
MIASVKVNGGRREGVPQGLHEVPPHLNLMSKVSILLILRNLGEFQRERSTILYVPEEVDLVHTIPLTKLHEEIDHLPVVVRKVDVVDDGLGNH